MTLQKKTSDIINAILTKENTFDTSRQYRISKKLLTTYTKVGLNLYKVNDKNADMSKCTQCGICEKICPVNAVKMTESQIHFQKDCEQCFACIHGCKQNAISFGKIIKKDSNSYRHPDVTLSEIIG